MICKKLLINQKKKKNLEIIACKIVGKYPHTFQDTVRNQTLGTGYSSLLCQLINRCENRKLGEEGKVQKILNADSYGCVRLNYLPDFTSDDDASTQDKQKELQEEYLHVTWNQHKVDLLMDVTYTAQRLLIVKNVEFEVVR
jgi:hypothetical protein